MSKEEPLPTHWRTALEPKRVTSIRGLARAASVSPMAASRLLKGQGTSKDTVAAVADSLFDGDQNRVWELYGSDVRDHGDWALPTEASLLTEEQRSAVLAVVRAMLPAEVKSGGAGARRMKVVPQPVASNDEQTAIDVATQVAQAARKGKSSGRRSRAEQDRDAESGGA